MVGLNPLDKAEGAFSSGTDKLLRFSYYVDGVLMEPPVSIPVGWGIVNRTGYKKGCASHVSFADGLLL
jgi:hypothetical protein